jgi:HD-like signal output (HDOD) protein/CheY-like chemotaxis protein
MGPLKMKRILFVDDETSILDGLRRILRIYRDAWDMHFVSSGKEALEAMENGRFDVIVADMRMPDMDGAKLLQEVHKRWPQTVRFILSGFSDMESTLRAVPVAHQFLSKPCDPALIKRVVDRACMLQSLLNDAKMQKIAGQIKSLPALPDTYARLTKTLENPNATTADISHVIEYDSSLCAKVLQIVNSSFFGLPRRVSGIPNAINYLGANMLRNLVLATEVFSTLSGKIATDFSPSLLQRHALLTANLARVMFSDKSKAEDAFMACLLHDVGKFVFAISLPEQYSLVLAHMGEGKNELELEREIFGITHAEMGTYLLGIWGLPTPIVEAVARHHERRDVKNDSFDVVDAVYIANLLVHEAEGSNDSANTHLDEAYLASLGVAQHLTEWRSKAAEVVRAEQNK